MSLIGEVQEGGKTKKKKIAFLFGFVSNNNKKETIKTSSMNSGDLEWTKPPPDTNQDTR